MKEDLTVRVGANVTGLNQALSRADKTVDRFATSVSRHAKRAAFAIGGIITAASILGAKFDKEMRFVGAITNATADEFEKLTAIAREMGRTTEWTAAQSAQGLRFLGMAGLSATEAIEALPGALDLATAGEMDLARAADIATNILAQFSMGVDQLTRVDDVLAKVQSSANTNIEQAAEAFVYGGTMAKQFGMEIEELAAFVGLLANRGIKASLAGTTMRQAMIKLINPSKEAQEVMYKYGITVTDSEGKLRNFTDVVLDMIESQVNA
ncbi:MAG: phage tail tape measure protein, partial [Asgard group archaeon]|nr:phage tail tape measure protein [Asgard group archaeon]